MRDLIDLIIAIVFIILFIFYVEKIMIPNSSSNKPQDISQDPNDNSTDNFKDTALKPGIESKPTHKISDDETIPYLRGMLHITSSIILPIIYMYMPEKNLSIESIILCCTLSGLYHQFTQYISPRYKSTFRLMDYFGSTLTILAYPMILFEKHNDTLWIDRMPLVVATIFVAEFILFHYHYHIHQIGEIDRMMVHVLCLIFGICHVIRYGDYMSPWFLLMFSLYLVAFYIFSMINSRAPEHYIWSQHETFHLILLFAFIIHIYISTQK